MALFGNGQKETKEEKQARKAQELLEKYGLQGVDETDLKTIQDINCRLAGSKLIETGTALTGNAVDSAKLTYFSTLVEQNWIIIRQLDSINKKLDRMTP